MKLTGVILPGAKYPRPGENLLAWSELRARTSAPSYHSGFYSPRASYGRIWASVTLSFQLFSSPIFQSFFVFVFFFLKATTTAVNWILSTHELVFTCDSKNSIFGLNISLRILKLSQILVFSCLRIPKFGTYHWVTYIRRIIYAKVNRVVEKATNFCYLYIYNCFTPHSLKSSL